VHFSHKHRWYRGVALRPILGWSVFVFVRILKV
jgi:hypothetical protein